MGRVVDLLGRGGRSFAEQVLGWNRGTIRKGQTELRSGQGIEDRLIKFSGPTLSSFGTTPSLSSKNYAHCLLSVELLLPYMPRHSDATDVDTQEKAKEVAKQLQAAGFSSIRME